MWYAYALAAGTLQTARNAGARRLAADVPAVLNSWARFAFNLPWALACVWLLAPAGPWPHASAAFLLTCAVGGLAQLLANVALVSAFRHATFTESIVLHKLEVVFTALAGALWFAEPPGPAGAAGILLCMLGTAANNLAASRNTAHTSLRARLGRVLRFDRGALLALTSAALLVVASFAVKRALGQLVDANPQLGGHTLLLPALTLLHVTWIEVLLLSLALLLRDRHAFRAVPRHLPAMSAVGLMAFGSSLCWYAAFTTGVVAYVRAVGQVEALLSVALGLWFFREPRTRQQLPGAALIAAGILLVLLAS